MGYGGWSKDSGSATQYTGDGGIDGIINEAEGSFVLGREHRYGVAWRRSKCLFQLLGDDMGQSHAGSVNIMRPENRKRHP